MNHTKPIHQTMALQARAELTFEERIKAAWDSDAALRAEFAENFETYTAFARAEASGRVKTFGGGAARYHGAP